MKKLFIVLISIFILVNCGKEKTVKNYKQTTPKTQKGIKEGFYLFKSNSGAINGPIEITYNSNRDVSVRFYENFKSQNLNKTYGVHPTFGGRNIKTFKDNSYFKYTRNVNYDSHNDIETDKNSNDLSHGRHYTEHKFYLNKNDRLIFTITIYSQSSRDSGSINKIVVKRTFKEVK